MQPYVWARSIMLIAAVVFIARDKPAFGQATNKGEIFGTVVDSGGGTIAGAFVKLTQLSTGFGRKTASNEEGFYTFQLVEPSDYELTVEKLGFKPETKFPIAVPTEGKVAVDFELQVGTDTQNLTVKAHGEILQTRDAAEISVVSEWQLEGLPLNDKLLSNFTRLEAGVTPANLVTRESDSNSDSGGFINGLRQFFTHVTLDGGYFDDPTWPGGPLTNTQGVSFDAVKEFAIIKSNADATQASAAGYTVNITTRNGSREYHGDLFEYFRNNIVDARNFFDGASTQPLRRNQFGGSFSGPVGVRKNKDFFFVNYEGFRRAQKQTIVSIVPTPLLLDNTPAGPSAGYLREIMSYTYARPTPAFGPSALVAPASTIGDLGMERNMAVARVDSELTPVHHALFRYSYISGSTAPGVTYDPGTRGGAIGFDWRLQNFLAGLTSTLGPHSVNELRFTFNRPRQQFPAEPTPPELVKLGFNPSANEPNGLPFIFFAGTDLTGDGVLPFVPKQRYSNVSELTDVFSTERGKHIIQFGATVDLIQTHWLVGENIRPSTVFIGFGPPFDASPYGITTGSFLSQTQNVVLTRSPIRGFRFTTTAAFVEDSYHPSENLFVHFGLRYSLNTPITEVNGLLSNGYPVDPETGSPVEDGDVNNGTIGNIALRNVRQFRFSQLNNHFAPNVGIAWRPFRDGRTVLRSGYSVSYGSPFIELMRGAAFNPPFGISTAIGAAPFGTRADPLKVGTPPALTIYDPASSDPSVQSWNLTIERALGENSVLRGGYIGNHGSHLWDTREPNYGAGFVGERPNPNYSVIDLTETKARSNYHALRVEVNSRLYRGLAFQGTYVFSKSLDDISAAVNTLCENGIGCLPTDQRNLRENYGPSDFDIKHSAAINFIYQLPLGETFLPTSTWLGSDILKGWSLSGIISYWDGLPFDILSGIDNNGDGVLNQRARVLPGVDPRSAVISEGPQYLNPLSVGSIFSQSQGTPLARNFFRGPDILNVDFGVTKSWRFGKDRAAQFGAEFFNLLNRTNFAIPINTLGSPLFGTIISTSTNSRQVQIHVKLSF